MSDVISLHEQMAARMAALREASVPEMSDERESHPQGPQRLRMPDHPTADNRGRVYAHRVAAWDAWGSGPHLCYVCGRQVYWLRRLVTADLIPCELRVGALDGNEGNTGPENLAPFCPECLGDYKRGAR